MAASPAEFSLDKDKIELSNGLKISIDLIPYFLRDLQEVIESSKLPSECSKCCFWICKDCYNSLDARFCRECETYNADCLILGKRKKCTDLFQFTKILLELI